MFTMGKRIENIPAETTRKVTRLLWPGNIARSQFRADVSQKGFVRPRQ
jgi:hypothetical protein